MVVVHPVILFTMLTARFLVDGEKRFLFIDYSRTKRRRRHALKGPSESIISLQCPSFSPKEYHFVTVDDANLPLAA